jgi:hypothetical protein
MPIEHRLVWKKDTSAQAHNFTRAYSSFFGASSGIRQSSDCLHDI